MQTNKMFDVSVMSLNFGAPKKKLGCMLNK